MPETALLDYQFSETEEACEELKANKPEKELLEEGSGRFL